MSDLTPQDLVRLTDLAAVAPALVRKEIESICLKAKERGFRAVIVNSSRVAEAFVLLEETEVKVISTIGFPSGAIDADAKRYEVEVALDNGAQEFELALNVGRLKDGEERAILRELYDVIDAAAERPVHLFLENGLLSATELTLAAKIASEAGIKGLSVTGNRFAPALEAVETKLPLKAWGAIAVEDDARRLLDAGANRLASTLFPKF